MSHISRPLTLGECLGLVGPGWHPLLEMLHADLAALGVHVTGVRRDEGALAVMVNKSCDASTLVEPLLQDYQDVSLSTCEECGSPGRRRMAAGPDGTATHLEVRCEECSGSGPVPGGRLGGELQVRGHGLDS